jgi:hypothetical protein
MPGSRFSGPQVRGICEYTPPGKPSDFDVIVAATARPEGGAYDTVVMYDGTAVTYGLLQWTFTSGRLHRLLKVTANAMGSEPYGDRLGAKLLDLTGLMVDQATSDLLLNGKRVTNFFSLRDVCTPPGGAVPRLGKNWELAKSIALLFSKLGEDPAAQQVQLSFFDGELRVESGLKRPKMGGRTIAQYLYLAGYDTPAGLVLYLETIATRALFWGMWQNSPRKAEEYLDSVGQDVAKLMLPGSGYSQELLKRLARKFASSSFANWGVAKAKVNKRTSRYEKVARTINEVMGRTIVTEWWK